MKKIIVFACLTIISSTLFSQPYQPNWASLNTRKMPAWFQQEKFGIFIHWGVYAVPCFAPVIPNSGTSYSEWYWYHLTQQQKDFKAFHDKTCLLYTSDAADERS